MVEGSRGQVLTPILQGSSMASLSCYSPQSSLYCRYFGNSASKTRITCSVEVPSVPCHGSRVEYRNRNRPLKVLVAGGGIGGLVFALAAKKKGIEVKVFEKDFTSVRGEGRDRGPIQLLSSALAVLQVIDETVMREIIEAGCVTGDRTNGLADGISGEWFAKFDMMTPAMQRGLPFSTVICRMKLQDILVNAVGLETLSNNSKVIGFRQDSDKVSVILQDGREFEGDVLVGADGIWSKVRAQLFGHKDANYSGFTCYAGLADVTPPYIDTVGYRVFLGMDKYFVACDVGNGKMQWYAFQKEPLSSANSPEGSKNHLLKLFENWCQEVTALILETEENKILQRKIYDRDVTNNWGDGRVTLLGDAAHPMQPNLGLGGGMAIEDCYHLINELEKIDEVVHNGDTLSEIVAALRRYEKRRLFRVKTVHAATRIASGILPAYRPYIDLQWLPWHRHRRIRWSTSKMIEAPVEAVMQPFMSWLIQGHGCCEE